MSFVIKIEKDKKKRIAEIEKEISKINSDTALLRTDKELICDSYLPQFKQHFLKKCFKVEETSKDSSMVRYILPIQISHVSTCGKNNSMVNCALICNVLEIRTNYYDDIGHNFVSFNTNQYYMSNAEMDEVPMEEYKAARRKAISYIK